MAKVTMTLTEALAKRNVLLKKLQSFELNEARSFVNSSDSKMIFVKKNSDAKIGHLTLEEAKSQAQSVFDKLFSTINNYTALIQAINEANVNNTVTIAGREMTIASAIAYKTSVVTKTKHNIIDIMKRQIKNADEILERYIRARDDADGLNNYLAVALGADPATRSPEAVKQQTELFYETNDASIIDPLNIREKVKILEENLIKFETEVDTALSVANANITIEVEYVD